MLKLNEESVLNSLKAVQDPDLHRDIVTLGFIKDIKIQGKDVKFDLVLTTPSCPVRDRGTPDC